MKTAIGDELEPVDLRPPTEGPAKTLFISRAGADADVAAEIGVALKAAGYGVILQQWDFTNRHFMERMHEALASGAQVVALLSPAYLSSDHCQAEWMNAIAGDPLNRKGRLILLRIADCAPLGLLAGLAYWDAVPVLNDAAAFSALVRRAVEPEQHVNPVAPSPASEASPAGAAQRPATVPPSNVPQDVKPLIGREHDIADIAALFEQTRIVTLVGVGGVGKTSCALKAGSVLRGDFPDGVWFVDLAGITDETLVAAEAGAVFGVVESGKRPVLEALIAHLRSLRTLIILDNCEQVIDVCSRLTTAVLRACPHVALLTTSREALKVSGEHLYHLSTLSVPERTAALTVDDALRYGAIALFAARARASDSRFELTSANVESVAEICRRLDGIPLAIELAAARARVLAPRQLEQKLGERFRLLTTGARSALPRQQTMRALIDWSYDLLDARERTLFGELSIFSGSFSLDSAIAVCANADVDEFEIVDGLTSLVEKSLVVAESTDGETRYRFLESLREYGRERLSERGGRAEAARRHALAYTELAERLDEEYGVTEYRTWVANAEREIENVRAALSWAFFDADGDIDIGLRLAGRLRRILNTSYPAEARRWIATALGRAGAHSPPLVIARLEVADAHLASRLNQFNAALAAARRALTLFDAAGDERGAADAQRWAGRSLLFLGDGAAGEQLLQSALDKYAKAGFAKVGALLLDLGSARAACHDLEGARDFFARALKQFEDDRDEGNVAITAGTLAEAEFQSGDAEAAVRHAQAALAAATDLPRHIALWIQSNLAAFLIALDQFERARWDVRAALKIGVQLQSDLLVAVLMQHLAAALALAPQPNLEALELAARLAGYVDRRLRDIEATREYTERQEYDRLTSALTVALGAETLAGLMDDGAALKDERALELALAAAAEAPLVPAGS